MPLYEYECDACGHRFEIIRKFSDPPVEKCPVCGGAVHKLQSAPAFHLKGSGWYITDYSKNGSSPPKSDDGKPASSEAKDSGASSTSSPPASTKESSAKKESSTKEGSSTT